MKVKQHKKTTRWNGSSRADVFSLFLWKKTLCSALTVMKIWIPWKLMKPLWKYHDALWLICGLSIWSILWALILDLPDKCHLQQIHGEIKHRFGTKGAYICTKVSNHYFLKASVKGISHLHNYSNQGKPRRNYTRGFNNGIYLGKNNSHNLYRFQQIKNKPYIISNDVKK